MDFLSLGETSGTLVLDLCLLRKTDAPVFIFSFSCILEQKVGHRV